MASPQLFRSVLLPFVALALLVITGCSVGGDGSDNERVAADDDATTTIEAGGDDAVGEAVTASVVDDGEDDADGEAGSDNPTTEPETTTTLEDSTTSEITEPETTTTVEATTTAAPVVIAPGDVGSFTSPSGNIACIMSADFGVSCWITEKEWTIAAPTEPNCEFDFGNAVDVSADGVTFPCYSDFSWDQNADPLAYGSEMQVGPFRCTSARDGVSCFNGDGPGFKVSRASVIQF